MLIPKYTLTNTILNDLLKIAEIKSIIEKTKILPAQALNLRRDALVRMTHHSTEIEGNRLNLNEVMAIYENRKVDAPQRDIYEVKNYINALKYIEKTVKQKKPFTEKIILHIHKLVTDKTLEKTSVGCYRKGPIYIVQRKLGMVQKVIYTGPSAKKVPILMKDLVKWTTNAIDENINPVLIAGIVHQELAVIHPFNDGNGRTARAVATLLLYSLGYDIRRLFALEDYYNTNREGYYKAIEIGPTYENRQKDFTFWLEYFVSGFRIEIEDVFRKISKFSGPARKLETQIYLTKDQQKILDFINELREINVQDVIDILSCPKRTAQYQLQKLHKLKLIKKINKGPRTFYKAVKAGKLGL